MNNQPTTNRYFKYLAYIVFNLIFISASSGKQEPGNSNSPNLPRHCKHCSFGEKLKTELLANPGSKAEIIAKEKAIQNFIELNSRLKISQSTYTIPVVVHILYHTPAEDVPDSQIVKMITILNEDFGRYNHDTANTPAAFRSVAAASPFQFCFASQDTNGSLTTGIDHFFTPTTIFSSPYIFEIPDSGGVAAWNTDKYFNIWIGNTSYPWTTEALPVSIYPMNHPYFGVLLPYWYANNIQLGDTTYFCGRGLTHAVGHCFNLLHPADVLCADADSVSDTPLEQDMSVGCPAFPLLTPCTPSAPGVMFMNYMDGVDDNCMNMFTQGQVARMVASMNIYYPSLLYSGACLYNAVQEQELNNSFIISPNPSQGNIFITAKKIFGKYSISFYDQTGRCLRKEITPDSENSQFNISEFADGIYFVKLIYQGGILIRRFEIIH